MKSKFTILFAFFVLALHFHNLKAQCFTSATYTVYTDPAYTFSVASTTTLTPCTNYYVEFVLTTDVPLPLGTTFTITLPNDGSVEGLAYNNWNISHTSSSLSFSSSPSTYEVISTVSTYTSITTYTVAMEVTTPPCNYGGLTYATFITSTSGCISEPTSDFIFGTGGINTEVGYNIPSTYFNTGETYTTTVNGLALGEIGEVVIQVQNTSDFSLTSGVDLSYAPETGINFLGYCVTTNTVACTSYSVLPASPIDLSVAAPSLFPLLSNTSIYVHLEFQVELCIPALSTGTYTSYWNTACCPTFTSTVYTSLQTVADPIVKFSAQPLTTENDNTPAFSTASYDCSASTYTCTMGVVYSNSNSGGNNLLPGELTAARATGIDIYLFTQTQMGDIIPSSIEVNGVNLAALTTAHSIPSIVTYTTNIWPTVNTYEINFQNLTLTAPYSSPFGSPPIITLQDLTGTGVVDDLAEGGSFTITATFQYTNSCPADLPSIYQPVVISPLWWFQEYHDQCPQPAYTYTAVNHTNYPLTWPYDGGSYYAYYSGAGADPSTLEDITGGPDVLNGTTFTAELCPEYYQNWGVNGSTNDYQFNCPRADYQVPLALPAGYTLDPSGFTTTTCPGYAPACTCYVFPGPAPIASYTCSGITYTYVTTPIIEDYSGCAAACTTSNVVIDFLNLPKVECEGFTQTYDIGCFNIPLTLNCNNFCNYNLAGSWDTLTYSVNYICDPSCTPNCATKIDTAQILTLFHHCSGHCPGLPSGVGTSEPLSFKRTTLGWFNPPSPWYYDCTSLPPAGVPTMVDPTNPLINLARAYPGDEVEEKINGNVQTNVPLNSIFLATSYSEMSNPPLTQEFLDLDIPKSSFTIIDPATSTTLTCSAVLVGTTDITGTITYEVELDPASAAMTYINATDDGSHNISIAADLFWVIQNGNPTNPAFAAGDNPINELQAEFEATYGSVSSPVIDKSCDPWGTYFDILQPSSGTQYPPPFIGTHYYNNYPVNCDVQYQWIEFVEEAALISEGEDDFPFEYRPYAGLSGNILAMIPTGYVVTGSATFYYETNILGTNLSNYSSPLPNSTSNQTTASFTLTYTSSYPVTGGTMYVYSPPGGCWPEIDLKNTLDHVPHTQLLSVPFQVADCFPTTYSTETVSEPTESSAEYVTGLQQTNILTTTGSATGTNYQETTNITIPGSDAEYSYTNPTYSITPQSYDNFTNAGTFPVLIQNTNNVVANGAWVEFTTTSPNIVLGTIYTGIPPFGTSTVTTYTVSGGVVGYIGTILASGYVYAGVMDTIRDAGDCGGSGPLYEPVSVLVGNNCSTSWPIPNTVCSVGSPVNFPTSLSWYPSDIGVNVGPSSPASIDMCTGDFTYTCTISNTSAGTTDLPNFWIDLPTGLSIVNAVFTYSTSTFSTTTADANNFGITANHPGWNLYSHSSLGLPLSVLGTPVAGLPGGDDITAVIEFHSSCGYDPNQPIVFYAAGVGSCGYIISGSEAAIPPIANTTPADDISATVSSASSTLGCSGTDMITLVVTNNSATSSNGNTDNVTVTLPSWIIPSNYSSSGGVLSGSNITWTINANTLTPLGTNTFTFDVSMGSPLTCENITIPIALTYTENVACSSSSCSLTSSFGSPPSINLINGCPSSPPSISISSTNLTCNGSNNGSATVTAGGAVTPYTYLWSNGTTNSSINSLSIGTYTLTVEDNNTCSSTAVVTITQPDLISVTYTQSGIPCFGDNNGVADVTITGGTSPYVYYWNSIGPNSASTFSESGLSSGTYTLSVTDANGCSYTESVFITQPGPLSIFTNELSGVSCNGGTDGVSSASVNGGTGIYIYSWSNGETSSNAMGLIAGNYTVTVTDANGCSASATNSISQPLPLSSTITYTNESCSGADDGSAIAVVMGGTINYIYSWSPGGETTYNLTGLSAGTYSVVITDANLCTTTASVTITTPEETIYVGESVFCGSGGVATAVINGGAAPFTYSWSPGGGTKVTETNLSAGTYTVTITNAQDCSVSASVTITQTASTLGITISSVVNANCSSSTGSITANAATGGTVPYIYSWSPSGGTNLVASNLSAGTYTITVTDSNGCTATASATITQSLTLIDSITSIVNACSGNNGSATVSANYGTSPYIYSWSGGAGTNATATGLSVGTYTVMVTDLNGCTAVSTVVISAPMNCGIITQSACIDGILHIDVGGGISPYTYSWSPPLAATTSYDGGETIISTGLTCCTIYTLSITDSAGCCYQDTFSCCHMNDSCSIGIQSQCFGDSLIMWVYGGTLPYSYSWSPPISATTSFDGGQLIISSNLSCCKTYTLTVTDQLGCCYQENFSCCNSNKCKIGTKSNCINGILQVQVFGGVSPYTYSWSPPPSATTSYDGSQLIISSGLSCCTTYTLSITDSAGCCYQDTFSCCNQEKQCNIRTQSRCLGDSLIVNVFGGTSPYHYSWSPPLTSTSSYHGGQIIISSGLSCCKTYTLTITDTLGCCYQENFTCCNSNKCKIGTKSNCINGILQVQVFGGISPYTYSWSPPPSATTSYDGSQLIISSGLSCCTIYTLSITDSSGCCYQDTFSCCNQEKQCNIHTQPRCLGDSLIVNVFGGTSPYHYSWSPPLISTSSYHGGQIIISSGLSCCKTYTLTITDTLGCCYQENFTCCNRNECKIGAKSNCFGDTLMVQAFGGASPYTYSWSPLPANTTSFDGGGIIESWGLSCYTTYTLTVTDGKGCCYKDTFSYCCDQRDLDKPVNPEPITEQLINSSRTITIYPNPNTGEFNISGLQIGEKLEVYDPFGRLLKTYVVTESIMRLNIKDEPNGLYLMLVISKDGIVVKRLKLAKAE